MSDVDTKETQMLTKIQNEYDNGIMNGQNVHHENALAFKALSNHWNEIPSRFEFIETAYNLHTKNGKLYYDSPKGETLVSGSQMLTLLWNLYNYLD